MYPELNGILVIGVFTVILAVTIYWLQARQSRMGVPKKEQNEITVVKARDWTVEENNEKETAVEPEEPAEETTADESVTEEPVLGAETMPEVKDIDQLSGIGPKYRALLREAGISTINQIAESNPEELLSLLKETNERAQITKRAPLMYNVERWIEAAKTQLA